ncbi:hypothetical protein ABH922_003499 [Rhodococcus sp. 27YEA15]
MLTTYTGIEDNVREYLSHGTRTAHVYRPGHGR